MKKILLACILLCVSLFAQDGSGGSSVMPLRTPIFVGGALGFGSGTGVGAERGLGLRQIEPMVGLWYPRFGYVRVGYGFYDYNASDDDSKYEIEHNDFDVELGVNLLGDVYVTGSYSRVKELSDIGDVAWNEWGAGFGAVLNFHSRALLFAEMSYRWVLDHYDPFLDKNIDGTRLQMNLGFAVYVY